MGLLSGGRGRHFVSSTALSLASSTVHTVRVPEIAWRSFHACIYMNLVFLRSVWYAEPHIFHVTSSLWMDLVVFSSFRGNHWYY